jgi:hypothetical protein
VSAAWRQTFRVDDTDVDIRCEPSFPEDVYTVTATSERFQVNITMHGVRMLAIQDVIAAARAEVWASAGL